MKAEDFLKSLHGVDNKFIDEADEYNLEKGPGRKYRYLFPAVLSAAAVILIISANNYPNLHNSKSYRVDNSIAEMTIYSYSSENTVNTSVSSTIVSETYINNSVDITSAVSCDNDFTVSEQIDTIVPEKVISKTEAFEAQFITEPNSVPLTEKTETFTSYASSDLKSQISPPPRPDPWVTTEPLIIPDIFYDAEKKHMMIYQAEAECEKVGQKTGTEKLMFYSEKYEEEFLYDIYSVIDSCNQNLVIIKISDRYYIYKKSFFETDKEEEP